MKKALTGKLGDGGLSEKELNKRLGEIDDELALLIKIKELKKEIPCQTNEISKLELELELAKLIEVKYEKGYF